MREDRKGRKEGSVHGRKPRNEKRNKGRKKRRKTREWKKLQGSEQRKVIV